MTAIDSGTVAELATLAAWVPKTVSPYANWEYSRTRPPSRSWHRTRTSASRGQLDGHPRLAADAASGNYLQEETDSAGVLLGRQYADQVLLLMAS